MFSDLAADQICWDARTVSKRLIVLGKNTAKEFRVRLAHLHSEFMVIGCTVLCDAACSCTFIVGRITKTHIKCLNSGSSTAEQSDHQRGVQATRQERTQGYVGQEMTL